VVVVDSAGDSAAEVVEEEVVAVVAVDVEVARILTRNGSQ
jgi:hypothetical protein